MPQYKNYAGQTITCPKQEGTCWQPEHLTKEQIRIQRNTAKEPVLFASQGIDGGSSWVTYDAYEKAARKYEGENKAPERPTHTAGMAIFDFATESLGVENVIVETNPDEENGLTGNVYFGTARDDEGMVDGVRYDYETRDGETLFYKKKSFGRRQEVTPKILQQDVYKERGLFQKWADQPTGSASG
jgi:hypothetical protein